MAPNIGAEKLPQVSSVLPDLPKAANLRNADPIVQQAGEAEHNPIFEALVTGEGEIAGLVAYSIYKQNKRAWLQAFIKATRRPPTDDELRAYVIGESTDRRLVTYRHLAAATLAGHGPETPEAYSKTSTPTRPGWFYIVGGLVLAAALGLLWFAVHSAAGIPYGAAR